MSILAFDFGTSGIKACLFDGDGTQVGRGYNTFEQIYPQPGWVEHDAMTIWKLAIPTAEEALSAAGMTWDQIEAIGITNQRETTVLWDVETGVPVYRAIVWQCRRTAPLCEDLKEKGLESKFREKTGLLLDPYFSGTKIKWIMENVPQTKELLEQGRLRFGTIDTWVIWNLTGRKSHVTDPTNASRTLLYDIHRHCWDSELCRYLEVEESILPEVRPSLGVLAETDPSLTGGHAIPISGVAGDQQAALYGQCCWEPGETKSTYGTGAFVMMNVGQENVLSEHGLLTTIGCNAIGDPCYALEGSIFISGAALSWLQNGLKLLDSPQKADDLVAGLQDNSGVYFVPAFVGIGAPFWRADVRGAITGITQDTGPAHLVRAALEATVYQTQDVLAIMEKEGGCSVESLRVDGGVTRSSFLTQFLADITGKEVVSTADHDLTARGAAFLAGIAVGFWKGPDAVSKLSRGESCFFPAMPLVQRESNYSGWCKAVKQLMFRD